MSNIPILEALKVYGTHFNVNDFLSLPVNTPFGNFNLTYSQIVIRIECLNDTIINLYKDFYTHIESVKSRGGMSLLNEGYKQTFNIEQVIYWLRKTADELISMIIFLIILRKTMSFHPRLKSLQLDDY